MHDDALIERAVAEVAASVSALDRTGWAALLLYMYGEDLSAVAWGMPDLDAPLEIDGDTMAELGMLDGDGEAVTTLRARVAGEDGWELQERFYLALAQHAHRLTGRPVLVSLRIDEHRPALHRHRLEPRRAGGLPAGRRGAPGGRGG